VVIHQTAIRAAKHVAIGETDLFRRARRAKFEHKPLNYAINQRLFKPC